MSAIDRRQSYGIHAYVGPNGAGKTLLAISDTIATLESGRKVLSTCRLLDYTNPRPCDDPDCECDKTDPDRHRAAHPLYIPFRTWRDLLDATHCDVLADEITGVASSRESHGLPKEALHALVQLRKRDLVFRYTCPAWARADLVLREVTQAVTLCHGYLPWRNELGWRRNRLVYARTYDTAFTTDLGGRNGPTPITRGIYRVSKLAITAYDTLESVQELSVRPDTGLCLVCGGNRKAYECYCPEYAEGRAQRRAPRREHAPADRV